MESVCGFRLRCGREAVLLVLAGVFASAITTVRAQQPADIVLHNGKILTVNASFSIVEAVAITGQRITGVGANQQVLAMAGPDTLKIDLKGRTVIPGLIDTHIHIYSGSGYLGELAPEITRSYPVNWNGAKSKEDVLNQIRGMFEKYKPPAGQWIYINNLIDFRRPGWTSNEVKIMYDQINRWELDKVTPNNPVMFSDGLSDWNLFLVNSKGWDILMANYGDTIKKYGKYWIDSNGQANGHMEPPASRLVFNYLPELPVDLMASVQKKPLEEMVAQGATTFATRLPKANLEAYKILEDRGDMITRLAYGAGWQFSTVKDVDLDKEMAGYAKQVGTGTERIWLSSVSPIVVDGAGTRSCTNLQRKEVLGLINDWWPMGQCHLDNEYFGAAGRSAPISGNYFRLWFQAMGKHGVRLAHIHTTGDRSVANLFDQAEQLQKQYGPSATKDWWMDHCELVNPKDFARAARLGIGCSFYMDNALDGIDEMARSYGDEVANSWVVPVKSWLDAGAKAVFETDGGPEWNAIELFVTRKDLKGKVWGAKERVDRPTILKMVTRWAAGYVLKPDQLGSIEVGKLADIAVLDRDFLTIPEDEISEIESNLTLLDGKIVYVNKNFAEQYNLRPPGAVISTYKELVARQKPVSKTGGMPGGGG